MLGTIVNTAAVIIGGIIGILIKGNLDDRYKNIVMDALGLSVMFIGASSALKGLMDENAEALLFIISLVIGGLIGERLLIEDKLEDLGNFIEKRMGNKESKISQGFVTASLVFCTGTMAILGSFESGMQGNHTTLFVKALLDGTSAIIFASTLGIGVLFSAASIFVYQGSLTLLSSFLEPFMTANMLREIGIVGGILIFAIGVNMIREKRIKIGNMLPAVLVPVIYYLPFVQDVIAKIYGLFINLV